LFAGVWFAVFTAVSSRRKAGRLNRFQGPFPITALKCRSRGGHLRSGRMVRGLHRFVCDPRARGLFGHGHKLLRRADHGRARLTRRLSHRGAAGVVSGAQQGTVRVPASEKRIRPGFTTQRNDFPYFWRPDSGLEARHPDLDRWRIIATRDRSVYRLSPLTQDLFSALRSSGPFVLGRQEVRLARRRGLSAQAAGSRPAPCAPSMPLPGALRSLTGEEELPGPLGSAGTRAGR